MSGSEVVHSPSEAERVLRLLASQLRALRSLPPRVGTLFGKLVCRCFDKSRTAKNGGNEGDQCDENLERLS